MRVAVLGIGGIGRAVASELRNDARVSSLLLVDRKAERARVLARIPGRIPVRARDLDVTDRAVLAAAVRDEDVLVNATLPKHNLDIMRVAVQVGAGYVDPAAAGASVPGGKLGIFEQLDLADAFKSAGRTAIVSMGLDPGMSNVMAREAAGPFDAVESIRIRAGGKVDLPEFEQFPLYSREAFLEDVLVPPTVWDRDHLEERAPLSEAEEFVFPDPVGRQRTFLVSHEEVKTLPRFLGKPVGRVDYKYALDPNLVEAALAMSRLGLLAPKRTVRVGLEQVPFREAFLQALPEPSAMLRPLGGATALAVEVAGTRGGVRSVRRGDIVLSHLEANRRRNTNAVNYLSAVGLTIGALLLGEKGAPGPGVVPPEALDPAKVWAEWKARGLPIAWSERAAA